MMNVVLRRRAIAAIETQLLHRYFSIPAASVADVLVPGNSADGEAKVFSTSIVRLPETPYDLQARNFHANLGPLNYWASSVLRAGIAVEVDLYENDEGLEIAKLGIAEEIVSALAKKAVLEPAMQGRDMVGRARTGSGKTLAFGIPIMDKIIQYNAKHGRGRYPLALVLAPTRELAKQVEKEFHDAAPGLDTICVYGGTPISQRMRQLDYGVDIAVGTSGCVIDLLKRGALNLSEVQFLVLDEADQMLQVGFQEDVEIILERLPQKR